MIKIIYRKRIVGQAESRRKAIMMAFMFAFNRADEVPEGKLVYKIDNGYRFIRKGRSYRVTLDV